MKGTVKQKIAFCILLASTMQCTLPGYSAPAAQAQSKPATQANKMSQYKIDAPICSKNLSIYLIRGPETLKGQEILTLDEGLSQKMVKVEETSNVNELKVTNNSDKVVFLQSGDIVRGGKQDRAIQYDMMLQPKTSKPLPVFCVEQGRWQQRGAESAASFNSSKNQLACKDLKLAAKRAGNQGFVWESVSKMQGKLSTKLGNACAAPSPSSFELTMDSAKVKQASQEVITQLGKVDTTGSDIVGMAFAINGKINSADVYANNKLFQKLYPKLIKAAAAEAVAESDNKASPPKPAVVPKAQDVQSFLSSADSKPATRKAGDKNYSMTEKDGANALMYTTNWVESKAKPSAPTVSDFRNIHANVISK